MASTQGRNLASVPVRRFLKPVFIRVHFVPRLVQSHILAIFTKNLCLKLCTFLFDGAFAFEKM